ncbi:MAG: rRNA maturation RNase YbeY [Pseudomonadota bacterium]
MTPPNQATARPADPVPEATSQTVAARAEAEDGEAGDPDPSQAPSAARDDGNGGYGEGDEAAAPYAPLILDERWAEDIITPQLSQLRDAFAAQGVILEPDREIALALSNDAHVADVNATFRKRIGPTNVLSFPAAAAPTAAHPGSETQPLGDLILAFETVEREACERRITVRNHTLHLIVHGTLHLLGHDHADEAQAQAMETLEVAILQRLGLPSPYDEHGAPAGDP